DAFNGSGYNLRIAFSARNSDPSIVRDILPGSASSNADNFTAANGLAYFTADTVDAQGGPKTSLWLSDGTLNRTTRLFDFDRGATLREFTSVGSKLYFVANNGSGNELWTSDGTIAGTKQVADLLPGAGSSNPTELTAVGNNLFFYTNIPPAGVGQPAQRLYRLDTDSATATPEALTTKDLTESGTFAEFNAASPSFTVIGNDLYFAARDENLGTELWRASVGSGGNVTLATMILKNGAIDGSLPSNLTNVNGTLYLIADVTQGNQEVVRIDTFSAVPNPSNFTVFNVNGAGDAGASKLTYNSQLNRLFFAANDASAGNELFTVNLADTNPAPQLVRDINTLPNGSSTPTNLVNVGGRLIFSATDSDAGSPTVDGNSLWITDGITTRKLSELGNGLGETDFGGRLNTLTNLNQFTVIGDNLFFVADNSTIGRELRQITLSGTVAAGSGVLEGFDLFGGSTPADPNTGTPATPNSSGPTGLTVVGSFIFFRANTGINSNGVEPFSVLP
ncbi:MAG: ELWxxDGT repeat protein, partial [Elainella sp.]